MNLILAATAASELGVSSSDPRLLRIVATVEEDFRTSTGRTFALVERVVYCRGFGMSVDYLVLPEWPVVEIAEVRYDPSGEFAAGTVLAAAEYFVDDYRLRRRNSWWCEGPRVAQVTFTAGYQNQAALPADLTGGLYEEVFARFRRGTDEQFLSASVAGVESFTRGQLGSTPAFTRAVRRYARLA